MSIFILLDKSTQKDLRLEELVDDGLTGEELKKTFNRMMQS